MLKYDLPTHILYNVHSKYTTNRSATNIKVAGLIKPVHLSKIAPSDNIGSSERNIGTLQTRRPTLTFFARSCDGSVADPWERFLTGDDRLASQILQRYRNRLKGGRPLFHGPVNKMLENVDGKNDTFIMRIAAVSATATAAADAQWEKLYSSNLPWTESSSNLGRLVFLALNSFTTLRYLFLNEPGT